MSKSIRNSTLVFLVCLAVHTFEVFVIRTDESIVVSRLFYKVRWQRTFETGSIDVFCAAFRALASGYTAKKPV